MAVLDSLLSNDPAPSAIETVEAWWTRHRDVAQASCTPVDAAVACGFAMDRLGWAFASGYQAAGRALLDAASDLPPLALCATEKGGVSPKVIETRLVRDGSGSLRLDGHKTYVTLGAFAEALLVLASEGPPAGDNERKRLRLVRVDARREGVVVEPRDPAPFVPEVPHARVRFDNVAIREDEVLPGDGWSDYVRPFRTIEDIHVHAALLGWLVQVARRFSFPPEHVELALSLIAAAQTLAAADPSSVATHRALAGMLETSQRLVHAMDPSWATVEESTRVRFERDRPLLRVATEARARRLAAARNES